MCHGTGVNGKALCRVSCSAAVSTLGCPLLCSVEGDGSVISVSRAGDLVTTEHKWHLQESGAADI